MKYLMMEEVAERLNVRPIILSQRFWYVKRGKTKQDNIYYQLYHNIHRTKGRLKLSTN